MKVDKKKVVPEKVEPMGVMPQDFGRWGFFWKSWECACTAPTEEETKEASQGLLACRT